MKHRYLDGIALGILLGFIASTLIYWLLDETTGVVQNFLSEQISYIVTLIAAVLAVRGISKQIQSNVELANEARLAKLDAAKATLPIVLSNLSRLCEARYYALAFGEKSRPEYARWEISESELHTLSRCIEHSTGIEKELMQNIFRIYQVVISRWDGIKAVNLFTEDDTLNPFRKREIEYQFRAITNWVSLKETCLSLFDFSRGIDTKPQTSEIRSCILIALTRLDSERGFAGLRLTDNAHYKEYVEHLDGQGKIEFIDDAWVKS